MPLLCLLAWIALDDFSYGYIVSIANVIVAGYFADGNLLLVHDKPWFLFTQWCCSCYFLIWLQG